MKISIILTTAFISLGLASPAFHASPDKRADCSFKSLTDAKNALAKNDLQAASDALDRLANDRAFCPTAARNLNKKEIKRLKETLAKKKKSAGWKQTGDWYCPTWAKVGSVNCYWTGIVHDNKPEPECKGHWVKQRAGYFCEK
ncbi:hypothetical protein VFPPC_02479 [Pochonia chlamydosporia 170]|uniref:Uncharacterized protein n=1 Tax=Pochonia chlamydosporia 170 TaxID=1380566 RepID=A0A179FXI2_METCM|nr:hypothetical protein VFPPC_02479 [Pochonia chlamydosporia 170]OAQ69928.1 hypothetical protein VFPPC_02479 [Pochonia chlamydosporia 170]